MWQLILKKPITIGTTKIGLKPLPEEEEDNCNRQLKAYADKLKNMKPQLKVEALSFSKNISSRENVRRYGIRRGIDEYIIESMSHEYNTLPEEIACEALGLLSGPTDEIRIGIYIIAFSRVLNAGNPNQDNFTELGVWKNSEQLLHLAHYTRVSGSKYDSNINDVDTRWWK